MLILLFLAQLPKSAPPPDMFWAWEKPENLSAAPLEDTGIALLVATLRLTPKGVMSFRRRQSIEFPKGIYMLATVRIEVNANTNATQLAQLTPDLLKHLRPFMHDPRFKGLQIDFDARESQRFFYRNVMQAIRQELPAGQWLSMTALASWCLTDPWMADFPVDEIVPMFFRMGADGPEIQRRLRAGATLHKDLKSRSVGLDPDEPVSIRFPVERHYWFHVKAWDETAILSVLKGNP